MATALHAGVRRSAGRGAASAALTPEQAARKMLDDGILYLSEPTPTYRDGIRCRYVVYRIHPIATRPFIRVEWAMDAGGETIPDYAWNRLNPGWGPFYDLDRPEAVCELVVAIVQSGIELYKLVCGRAIQSFDD